MSFQTFCGKDPNDAATYQKLLGEFMEGGAAGAMTLGAVLEQGNSALSPTTGLPQDATDFDLLGCKEIATGKVYQGNNLALEIGEPLDTLKLKGAITKGSINVGNGAITESLPVGANGLFLKANSFTGTGLEWAVGGGVSNPIVLADATDTTSYSQLGLTKTIGVNPLTIQSNTSNIQLTPFAGTDLDIAVGGAGKVHITETGTGGSSQPAISIENNNGNANAVHIDLYKNSASPAAADGIGEIGFHANSSTGVKTNYVQLSTTLNDPTNASQNASLSVACCVNSATPTEFFRFNGSAGTNQLYRALDVNNQLITSSGNALTLYQDTANDVISINNVATNGVVNVVASGTGGDISIQANDSMLMTGSSINLTSNNTILLTASTGSGVQVNQSANARTQLRTTITPTHSNQPVEFVPEVNIDNQNLNSVPINFPQMFYQKLHLLNNGVSPTISWADVGGANGNVSAMYLAAGGYVWLGIGASIVVSDTTFSTIYQIHTLSGGSTIEVYAFLEYGGYMFVGGVFDGINGNATPQYGLTRIYTAGGSFPMAEDPMYDTTNSINGVQTGQFVYALATNPTNGNLYVGGNFTQFSNGSVIGYGFQVQSPTSTGGSQTYDTNSGVFVFNNVVETIVSGGSYTWWGGSFTSTNSGGNLLNYIAAYDNGGIGWAQVALNGFNGVVRCIVQSSVDGNYMLVGGSFSQSGWSNLTYVDTNSPNNSETNPNQSVGGVDRNCLYGTGGLDLVASNSGDNYQSTGFTAWTTLGMSNSGIAPSGAFYYSGSAYNSYATYPSVRNTISVSQSASFVLGAPQIFRYLGAEYQTFTLPLKWTAQEFMADATGSYWTPLGSVAPSATFS